MFPAGVYLPSLFCYVCTGLARLVVYGAQKKCVWNVEMGKHLKKTRHNHGSMSVTYVLYIWTFQRNGYCLNPDYGKRGFPPKCGCTYTRLQGVTFQKEVTVFVASMTTSYVNLRALSIKFSPSFSPCLTFRRKIVLHKPLHMNDKDGYTGLESDQY